MSNYWHAIARLDDGTEFEFNRAYTANGNYAVECEQQYRVECELLARASSTGKEVVFYSVDFVSD